jgi:hypothetical protein
LNLGHAKVIISVARFFFVQHTKTGKIYQTNKKTKKNKHKYTQKPQNIGCKINKGPKNTLTLSISNTIQI